MAKDGKKPRKEITKKSTNTAKNTMNRSTKHNLRPNPEDNIAKSKKLVEKTQKRKSSVNAPRSFIQSRYHSRVCSNGKPMPPLSELERMYEDSDDDNQSKTLPSQINKSSTHSSPKISTDSTTITENGATLSPPKKRKKFDCKDRPQILKQSSTNSCNDDDIDIGWEDEDDCPKNRAIKSKSVNVLKPGFNNKSDNIAAWLQDCGKEDNSDASNDSNKTVDYDYTNNIGRPQQFSPLPSTSKDRATINKNDQLFNESFISETGMSNDQSKISIINDTSVGSDTVVKPNEVKKGKKKMKTINVTNSTNLDDIEIIQSPCETIVIDDEIVNNRLFKRKYNNKSDIVECIDIPGPIITEESTKVSEYSKPIVIDDEDDYKFINDSPTRGECTEVIDIDNIIAENKAIIDTYSKKNETDINTVTCVDTSTISNLNTANSAEPSNNSDTHDATERKDNIVSKNGEGKNKYIRDIVTNYFSNNNDNQNLYQEMLHMNAAGDITWSKVKNWLNNLTPYYPNNKRKTSRNKRQNDPSNDSVIVIDDVPSPALNNPNRPSEVLTPTDSPPHTNYPDKRVMLLNGVVQRHTNITDNPIVNLGPPEDFEYINMYQDESGDVYLTGSDIGPPAGVDCSKFKHKRVAIREIMEKQAGMRSHAALPFPAKKESPRLSKNFGDCPICMESLSNKSVASTICGHVFCMRCIEAAFRASGKRCPTCRKVLKKGGYHQIFL